MVESGAHTLTLVGHNGDYIYYVHLYFLFWCFELHGMLMHSFFCLNIVFMCKYVLGLLHIPAWHTKVATCQLTLWISVASHTMISHTIQPDLTRRGVDEGVTESDAHCG
jgi:hypothetical protein